MHTLEPNIMFGLKFAGGVDNIDAAALVTGFGSDTGDVVQVIKLWLGEPLRLEPVSV